jgi:hypothetical protein
MMAAVTTRSSTRTATPCLRFFSKKTIIISSTNASSSRAGVVERMRDVVATVEGSERAWDTLWQEGITPWDLGGPTKVLISELAASLEFPNNNNNKNASSFFRPSTCLIPGCGAGYDLVSLARYLDNSAKEEKDTSIVVIGMDISSTSLERAKKVVKESLERDGPFQTPQTRIELYKGDFFASPSTWNCVYGTSTTSNASTLSSTSTSTSTSSKTSCRRLKDDQTFEFIFDYTFFCTLPPHLRKNWGDQMHRLLLKGEDDEGKQGRLLTLMFPYTHKIKPKAKGPPYPLGLQDYQDALSSSSSSSSPDHHYHFEMEKPLPYSSLDTVAMRQGQEVVGWWRRPAGGTTRGR